MRKTIFIKIFCIILFTIFLCSLVGSVYSVDTKNALDNILNGEAEDKANIMDKTKKLSGSVITIFQVVAMGVAVIMLIVLAMKYMMAAPGDKADIKKHAIVYIVGAVTMFATAGILSLLDRFSKNFEK